MAAYLANGLPRYVRCYDNGGESADRYTVVFSRLGNKLGRGRSLYLGMNAYPYHPQGIGMHGESSNGPIDRPTSRHLGKRVAFESLPEDCRKLVMRDYVDLWGEVRS